MKADHGGRRRFMSYKIFIKHIQMWHNADHFINIYEMSYLLYYYIYGKYNLETSRFRGDVSLIPGQ